MFKLAALAAALAAPAAASSASPSSEATILAATTSFVDYVTWARAYISSEKPGIIQRFEDPADDIEYAEDYIGDGGGDLFDGGNEIEIRKKSGKVYSNEMQYTRRQGPKLGALVSKDPGGGYSVTYTMQQHNRVFAGVYKLTDGSEMDQFRVMGEMGSDADQFVKGAGSFTFNSVGYEFFWQFKKEDSSPGKYDIIVINSEDGGKHCLSSEMCGYTDYDYHRVWDTTDGFTEAGFTMFKIPAGDNANTMAKDFFTASGDAFSLELARYLAGFMTNML